MLRTSRTISAKVPGFALGRANPGCFILLCLVLVFGCPQLMTFLG